MQHFLDLKVIDRGLAAYLSILFTQITINYIFDREVRAPVAHVIPSTKRGMLLPQVHFKMREEVHLFPGCEW